MSLDPRRLTDALDLARSRLLAQRTPAGHWVGELSTSALSTATAVFALELYARAREGEAPAEPSRHSFLMGGMGKGTPLPVVPRSHGQASTLAHATDSSTLDVDGSAGASRSHGSQLRSLISRGLTWLRDHQNPDGGWGDTTKSLSNISTTTLCWSAFSSHETDYPDTIRRCESWLKSAAGSLDPEKLANAITARYGKDKTFSVPILTMAALAGRLGSPDQAWRLVPQLPFELAAAPHPLYAALRLPVVSYALPALIAIGQVRHALRPTRNPLTRILRNALKDRTLNILRTIQPRGGGFLEAAPLTSFVSMSLIAAGLHDHPVVTEGIDFLIRSVRPDGSWPIDTNLSTWVTTLSINALSSGCGTGGPPVFLESMGGPPMPHHAALTFLLNQQFKTKHPYTHAAPGGWAWTDLLGGVPDADDTAGALVALHNLAPRDPRVIEAAQRGITWLLDLQNRDGGIPTFCRGWTGLPFDRSGADLTAHALNAFAVWMNQCPPPLQARIRSAIARGHNYLRRAARPSGAWTPLWFGNQHAPNDENPVYGTARVISGLAALRQHNIPVGPLIGRGSAFLHGVQNPDGGWGGDRDAPSSVEETALAVHALAITQTGQPSDPLLRGITWLTDRVDKDELDPSPIGFYFARLWYYERLYPLIFTIQALSSASKALALRAGSGRL